MVEKPTAGATDVASEKPPLVNLDDPALGLTEEDRRTLERWSSYLMREAEVASNEYLEEMNRDFERMSENGKQVAQAIWRDELRLW